MNSADCGGWQSLRGQLPAKKEEEEEEVEEMGGVWTRGRLPSPWPAGSLLRAGREDFSTSLNLVTWIWPHIRASPVDDLVAKIPLLEICLC